MERRNRQPWIWIATTALALAALACTVGGSGGEHDTGTAILPTPTGNQEAPVENKGEMDSDPEKTYQPGEEIHFGSGIIRINSISYSNHRMQVNLSIQNQADHPLDIDPQEVFTAVTQNGQELDLTVLECGRSKIYGRILAGDRLRGNICWKEASPNQEIEITFQADFLDGDSYRWQAVEGNSNPDLGPVNILQPAAGLGEPVIIAGHQVTLLEIDSPANVLRADFLIDNTTEDTIQLSSLLALEARRSDGSRLARELSACGGETLNGTIQPGESLNGSACWSQEEGGAARLYYLDLFSGEVVYWDVE